MIVPLLILLSVLAYTWLLYPLILLFVGRRSLSPAPRPGQAAVPSVAAIIAAYNEEGHIAERLCDLARLDYPAHRLTVHVGSDGSTDRTVERADAAAAADHRVCVTAFPENRGKAAVLRDLVAAADADILLFTDANTVFEADALQILVRPFADPNIGGVCGRLVFREVRDTRHPTPSSPEAAYWSWETRLKQAESRMDSCLGANGAIYAIRRGLFWRALPPNTIVDDFVIGMKVREQGSRMVYAPAAVAREELPQRRAEWRRRVRIGAGDFQALWLCRRCLLPRYGSFAWMFWSHKVLRWFTPHLLLASAVLAAGGILSSAGPVVALAGLVLAGFAALIVGALLARIRVGAGSAAGRILHLCDHFLTMQAALFIGFLRFCRGNLKGSWHRTPRG